MKREEGYYWVVFTDDDDNRFEEVGRYYYNELRNTYEWKVWDIKFKDSDFEEIDEKRIVRE